MGDRRHNLPELVLYLSGPIVLFFYLMTVRASLALVSIAPILLVVAVMVSFSYVENEPILKDISFTIPEHKLTAIVGDSGSGKSTILNLISRYYKPSRGQIGIGGHVEGRTKASIVKH